MTQLRKLAFPLKWTQMEKRNYETILYDPSPEDQTVVDIIGEPCESDPQDILIIIG